MKAVASAILAAIHLACASPVGPLETLERAQARWNARPFSDYRFDYSECGGPGGGGPWCDPVTIEVRGGRITDAYRIGRDGVRTAEAFNVVRPTMDDVFESVRRAIAEREKTFREAARTSNPAARSVLEFQVSYHQALGYPARIALGRTNVEDGWGHTSVSRVHALQ